MAGLVEQRLWSSEGNPGSSVPPKDGHGAPKLGGRAVVIGAGMGGLAAAGALAKHFERVDILERDRLTSSVGSVPQSDTAPGRQIPHAAAFHHVPHDFAEFLQQQLDPHAGAALTSIVRDRRVVQVEDPVTWKISCMVRRSDEW